MEDRFKIIQDDELFGYMGNGKCIPLQDTMFRIIEHGKLIPVCPCGICQDKHGYTVNLNPNMNGYS